MARLPLTSLVAAIVLVLSGCSGEGGPRLIPPPVPTAADGLPGEPYTWPYKTQGKLRVVVGHTLDDSLQLHKLPDERSETVAEMVPLDDSQQGFATGRYRKVEEQIWIELAVKGKKGWTPVDSVSQVGAAEDLSRQFRKLPHDPDLAELAQAIAVKYAGSDAVITVIDLRTGKNPYVILDAIGTDDSAILGYRFHVTPGLGEAGFSSGKVIVSPYCARSLIDGVCV